MEDFIEMTTENDSIKINQEPMDSTILNVTGTTDKENNKKGWGLKTC